MERLIFVAQAFKTGGFRDFRIRVRKVSVGFFIRIPAHNLRTQALQVPKVMHFPSFVHDVTQYSCLKAAYLLWGLVSLTVPWHQFALQGAQAHFHGESDQRDHQNAQHHHVGDQKLRCRLDHKAQATGGGDQFGSHQC